LGIAACIPALLAVAGVARADDYGLCDFLSLPTSTVAGVSAGYIDTADCYGYSDKTNDYVGVYVYPETLETLEGGKIIGFADVWRVPAGGGDGVAGFVPLNGKIKSSLKGSDVDFVTLKTSCSLKGKGIADDGSPASFSLSGKGDMKTTLCGIPYEIPVASKGSAALGAAKAKFECTVSPFLQVPAYFAGTFTTVSYDWTRMAGYADLVVYDPATYEVAYVVEGGQIKASLREGYWRWHGDWWDGEYRWTPAKLKIDSTVGKSKLKLSGENFWFDDDDNLIIAPPFKKSAKSPEMSISLEVRRSVRDAGAQVAPYAP